MFRILKFHKHFFIDGAVALLSPIHTVFTVVTALRLGQGMKYFYTTLEMKFKSVCVGGGGGGKNVFYPTSFFRKGEPLFNFF